MKLEISMAKLNWALTDVTNNDISFHFNQKASIFEYQHSQPFSHIRLTMQEKGFTMEIQLFFHSLRVLIKFFNIAFHKISLSEL